VPSAFKRFDCEYRLGTFEEYLLGNAAEQQLAHWVPMPDADYEPFGVVAFHRLEQFLCGVDADRLSEFRTRLRNVATTPRQREPRQAGRTPDLPASPLVGLMTKRLMPRSLASAIPVSRAACRMGLLCNRRRSRCLFLFFDQLLNWLRSATTHQLEDERRRDQCRDQHIVSRDSVSFTWVF
jgi:hypothetical protein